MIQVPDEIKALLHQDTCKKNIRIHFPNGERTDICNNLIVKDSVSFTESLCSQDSLKFGLCEAPVFECETVGVGNIRGMDIEVSCEVFCAPDAEGAIWKTDLQHHVYPVVLGTFRVDTCQRQADINHRKIVAYGGLSNYNFDHINDAIDSPQGHGDGAQLHASKLIALALQTDALLENESKTVLSPTTADTLQTGYAYEIKSRADSTIRTNYIRLYSDTQDEGSYTFSRVYNSNNTPVTVEYNHRAYFNNYSANTDLYNKYTPDGTKNLIDFHNFPYKRISDKLSNVRGYMWNLMQDQQIVIGNNTYAPEELVISPDSYMRNESIGLRRDLAYEDINLGASEDLYTVESMRFWKSINLRFCRDYLYSNFTYVMFKKNDGTKTSDYAVTSGSETGILWKYLKILDRNNLNESCSLAREEIENQILMLYEDTETLDDTGAIVYGITSDDYGPQLYKEDLGENFDLREFTQATTELRGGFLYVDHFNVIKLVDIKQQFGLHPSNSLYPGDDVYPEGVTGGKLLPQDYRSCWYDDEYTKPFGAIYCEYKNTSQEDASFTLYLTGFNSSSPADSYQVYDLTGNSFITEYAWTQAQIQAICNVIADNIDGVTYMPVEFTGRGLPYVEAGDTFEILTKSNDSITTIVLNRTLSGEQTLTDQYKSTGSEGGMV